MENLDNEEEREYQEYLQRVKEQKEQEEAVEEQNTLNTGINAIDNTYLFDDRVKLLLDAFERSIDYIEDHTDLTETEIKMRINKSIREIEFKDEFSDNNCGVGCVDDVFGVVEISSSILKENPEEIYEFIRHEMTHMIGLKWVKTLFKKLLNVSGYSLENSFDVEPITANEFFNEAAVEMFCYQDEEYREEEVFDYKINTNQDLNGGYYCLNSNLIHQMLIAKEISDKEFFNGLYDYKRAKKVIGKFKRNTFKKLSLNMDSISKEINDYYEYKYMTYDVLVNNIEQSDKEMDISKPLEELDKHKQKLEEVVSISERMIIDKMLLPTLRKMPESKKQALLDEYYNFMISEREYFKSKTNYRAITVSKKQNKFWVQHVNIEQLDMESLLISDGQNLKENGREE